MNNTTANTTATATAIEESGILDTLMDSPELMLATGIIAGLGGYIAYTQPKVRALIMPYIKKYDDEIMDLLEKNLTKAQLKAYSALDEQVKKQVNNKILQDIIMSAWDEKDDMMADAVKNKVRDAMK